MVSHSSGGHPECTLCALTIPHLEHLFLKPTDEHESCLLCAKTVPHSHAQQKKEEEAVLSAL